MLSDKEFVVIEGNIGSGKTSLVKKIAPLYDAKVILETFEDNPFLPKFYEDRERYAFPVELSFLAARYRQLKKEIQNKDLFHRLTIADYHFLKSLIFAGETLPDDEYRLYRQLFDIIYEMVPVPDLYVYLHRPVDVLLEFIAKRGRDYEKLIDAAYLKKIQSGYFRFFKEHPEMKIVVIDLGYIDFIEVEKVFDNILDIMNSDYSKGLTYRYLMQNE
jgi:deoxyadenosine/deoxycytidine kinase